MVAQLLAHIDALDTALQNLSDRIEYVLTPHAQIVELLSSIAGVQAHAAQFLIAECGLDMSHPTAGHFASWPASAQDTTNPTVVAGPGDPAPAQGGSPSS